MTPHLLMFLDTMGIMSICSLLYGVMQRHIQHDIIRRAGVGLILGCGAVIVMAQPITLAPGLQADARGAFVGMAAAFGGPAGALMAVLVTIAARSAIGGEGAFIGALVIAATALGAGLLRSLIRDDHKRTWTAWMSISLACIAPSAFALFAITGSMSNITVSLSILIGVIVVIFGRMLEAEERRGRRERQLTWEAATDSLTGLANRRALDAHAKRLEQERATEVLFLLVDVDHFKKINDEFGHDEGDLVLRRIGAAIHDTVRVTDFVARVGGEEFAIIVRPPNSKAGQQIAERFRMGLRVPFGRERETRVSIGGVFFGARPFRYKDAYRHADQALYLSKTSGRDRVTFCEHQDS